MVKPTANKTLAKPTLAILSNPPLLSVKTVLANLKSLHIMSFSRLPVTAKDFIEKHRPSVWSSAARVISEDGKHTTEMFSVCEIKIPNSQIEWLTLYLVIPLKT